MREIEGIRIYTTAEVAKQLGVTAATVRAHIKTGRLKAQRFGKSFTVTGDDLRAFLTGEPATPAASNGSRPLLP